MRLIPFVGPFRGPTRGPMRGPMRGFAGGFIGCLVSAQVVAEPVFFQHRVADPLNLLAAIPALSSPHSKGIQVQVAASYVNVFSGGVGNRAENEDLLVMDGEIGQIELRAQVALSECYSFGFDSRFISHSGGSFDEEINAWHQFFNLPDAMRELSPYDSLNYFFSSNAVVNANVDEFSDQQTRLETAQQALGDVWLSVQRPLNCSPSRTGRQNPTGHVRLGVKLPLDSITDGVSAWASGGQAAVFADWHASPYHLNDNARITTTAGVSYSGEWADRFEALPARRVLGYGAVVFDYRWNPTWQSVVQLDIRSPTFHSELTEIGNWGAQIHVGARVALAAHHQVEFSISEDAAIDTAPDIGVRIAYSYTP